MRPTAEKRHNDWQKAIRKRNLSHYYGHWIDSDGNEHEYYDNLHQFSKNKIHCSCPFCRSKTAKKKQVWSGGKNWSITDRKKIDEMKEQVLEEE